MCGICGVVFSARSGRMPDEPILTRMRDVLSHRGPDEYGLVLSGRAGLGHRRLSIVDVAGGRQPMASDDGRFHIVYNGEVYNHTEIRPELERRGHRYRTRCDTETVLRLFQEYGPRCVDRLRGMFAFAIWDRDREELFLARDRLGIKPLYYVHSPDGSLHFASEIKALLEAGAVRPAFDFEALPDYLANHAPSGDRTLFDGVRRLPAGHTLLWREGKVTIERYWDVTFEPEAFHGRSPAELIREFEACFEDAVRARLMADVPLGVFLSGGIDSAAIAATTSRLVGEPIKTFSVAFAEREANELAYARIVARAFGTDHHEVIVTPDAYFEALPRLIWHEDEPIAHPSSVPLHFVARLAAEHVKVVLTGEGSDELLAGYARYWKTRVNLAAGSIYERMTPAFARNVVRRGIEALPVGFGPRQKLLRSFFCNPATIDALYFDAFAVFPRAAQARLLTADTLARTGTDPYRVARGHYDRYPDASTLGRLLYADIKTYLHELLMKQDQMSMAASIESRVPFLDQRLVEFAAKLPDSMKLRGRTTKFILRKAMAERLPREILERSKMGFPVPFGAWVGGPYRNAIEELLLGERAAARGLFDPAYVRQIVAEHGSGTVGHATRLWSLVNLELWQRIFLDGEPYADLGSWIGQARPTAVAVGRPVPA